jgi:hypothetical protein
MKTRSQSRSELNNFIFDFDESSRYWKQNKKSMKNGTYVYVCQKQNKSGALCSHKCLPRENYCKKHLS